MITKAELAAIIKKTDNGVLLPCMIQPRSSQNKIVGLYGEMLKIKLTAPPVDGKANVALIKYMSKLAGIPSGKIAITAGQTSRRKTVLFTSMTTETLIENITGSAGTNKNKKC
jgi:uncharacterized protein